MTSEIAIRFADGPANCLTIRLPAEPLTHIGQVVLLEGGGFGVVADEYGTVIRRIGERDWTWDEAQDFATEFLSDRQPCGPRCSLWRGNGQNLKA